ncbi:hypothetical protein ACJJTC_015136 [Scirpophaga incertulas]
MLSPTHWLKKVGLSPGLVPFFKCVCVYFAAGVGAAPSAVAVAAKCAPVLSLLLLLLWHRPRVRYGQYVCAGLALSALGDALLVFEQGLAPGIAAFAAAHIAYIAAFGWGSPRFGMLGLALYVATTAFVWQLPHWLGALVPAYAALLATTAWRGVARGGRAAVGAVLFLLSDAVLALQLFSHHPPLPYHQVLVMASYYLGQLGIALSVFENDCKQQ